LGLEMALACDVRIASETSKFGLSQIRAGLVPWDGGTQRLFRTVEKAKALEMILTGELIEAQEANHIGLVSRIVPRKDLLKTVEEMARKIASCDPMAVRFAKEAVARGMNMSLQEGLDLETLLSSRLRKAEADKSQIAS
jgi:enoyl-CoA hydratase